MIKNGNKCNFIDIRNKIVTLKNNEKTINKWELETPKEVRAHSVKDVIKAYKTSFGNLRNKNIQKFDIKYKSKKQVKDSIGVQKSSVEILNDSIKIYSRFLGKIKLGKRTLKKYKNTKVDRDCRLQYDGIDYYLCIPIKAEKYEKEQKNKIISFDPGSRTFLTGYDPDGKIIEYKTRKELLKKYNEKIDLLKSQRKQKRKIRKKIKKMKNIINDLHWKVITDIRKEYNTVLLPIFESQEMVIKSKNKNLNRDLNILSHYKFKERLKYKIRCCKNIELYNVTEEYTSKTCSYCGEINNIGSRSVFECKKCYYKIGRDINAARNILLKNLRPASQGL